MLIKNDQKIVLKQKKNPQKSFAIMKMVLRLSLDRFVRESTGKGFFLAAQKSLQATHFFLQDYLIDKRIKSPKR